MSKIVLTADVHFGYPNKLDDVLYAMRAVRQYMAEHSISCCVILGDLYHTRQSIATDVMHKSYEFFRETKEQFGQSWMVFPGNHDMFLKNSWKIHSLKMLSNVLSVYDKPAVISIEDSRFWLLPFVNDEDVYMRALRAIEKQAKPDDVLLTHIGVNDAKLNECFLNKNWSIVNFTDFPLRVYAGHFHCHQQVGKQMWYPGSPIPFRADEGLVDHGFIVYDTETRTHEFVLTFGILKGEPKPPDFPTIADVDLESVTEDEIRGNKVRIALSKDYTNDERVEIRKKLVDLGALEVSWMKTKEVEVDISSVTTSKETISLGNPDFLLKTWFELDKPEHLDFKILSDLNKDIVSEGNERLIERGSTADED